MSKIQNSIVDIFLPILKDRGNIEEPEIRDNLSLMNKWKQLYFPSSPKFEDINLWHSFSFGIHERFLTGENAIEQFELLTLKKIIIFSFPEVRSIKCESISQNFTFEDIMNNKAKCRYNIDIYISHLNFNWTFVIPHEKEFGPYFASKY